ncbi:MAG: ArsR/SmtB family transcription factor [Candidatus Thorarchaeota archaeon]|jgi:DNA-binding transcriptional ArsR family regulator
MMSHDEEKEQAIRLMELLSDPVRSRIYLEVLLTSKVTAQQLMDHLTIGRSTLTHHLTKLVESGILDVTVQPTGRPVKSYSLSSEIQKRVEIEVPSESAKELGQRIAFLESAASHLQMIANLAREGAESKRAELERKRSESGISEHVCFTFLLMSERQAKIWNQEYTKFLNEVEKKIDSSGISSDSSSAHIAFAGLIPIVRREVENHQ